MEDRKDWKRSEGEVGRRLRRGKHGNRGRRGRRRMCRTEKIGNRGEEEVRNNNVELLL